MKKTILITGATDGIGLATAKTLVELGHTVLLHGRSEAKLANVKKMLADHVSGAVIETYIADLSVLAEVKKLAAAITAQHDKLDVLINNAGVYSVTNTVSTEKLDIRFVVNTIAPYFLTQKLLPILHADSRVINLSSAAQAPVAPEDLLKASPLSDGIVYAQSKLALLMWSRQLALSLGDKGPVVVAINPASMLGSKMVKEAYGVNGGDLQIGADVLVRAALSSEFANASGKYFDNDKGRFSSPHPDGVHPEKIANITRAIEEVWQQINHEQ